MPTPSKRQLLAGLLAALALSACSSSSSSSSSTTAPSNDTAGESQETEAAGAGAATLDPATLDVCEVLSKAEVEAAFGEAVTVDASHTGECWWENKSTLKSMVFKRDTAPDTPEGLEERRNGFDNTSWEPIDLGTEGFQGKVLPSVDWLVGGYNFELNIAWSTKGDPMPIVEKLARAVDSRLVHPS